MILPTGNLYLLLRSQMRTFDVTQQMIKIKEKKRIYLRKKEQMFIL